MIRRERTEAAEAFRTTALGPVPSDVLAEIKAFGQQADRFEYPLIDVGGRIAFGGCATIYDAPITARQERRAMTMSGSTGHDREGNPHAKKPDPRPDHGNDTPEAQPMRPHTPSRVG